MKIYDLDTKFTFGNYEGQTVRQIIDVQPSYIEWCSINLNHFYIPKEVIEEIQKIRPDFILSNVAEQKLDEKHNIWANQFNYADDNDGYIDNSSYQDQTDWSNYDDNLDMDQQSIEFWNQF